MSAPVRIGPVPPAARLAAYPIREDRGGPDAQARRDQLFVRAALLERRRAFAPDEREAFDERADEILARLDPAAAEAASAADAAAALAA